MGNLYLVRHAKLLDVQGMVYGADAEIDPATPRESFVKLAAKLPANALLVVSGMPRTEQTAIAVLSEMPKATRAFAVFDALSEQSFGQWVGRTHASLKGDKVFERLRSKKSGWADVEPPDGESFNQLCSRRVGPALEDFRVVLQNQDVVAFTHAGCVRAGLVHATGITPDEAMATNVKHLSVTVLQPQDKGWKLISAPN